MRRVVLDTNVLVSGNLSRLGPLTPDHPAVIAALSILGIRRR